MQHQPAENSSVGWSRTTISGYPAATSCLQQYVGRLFRPATQFLE